MPGRGVFRAPWTALVVVLVATGVIVPTGPAESVSAGRSTYIVELAAKPLVTYSGGIRALEATSPRITGHPLDPASPQARRYEAFLDGRQRQALRAAGATDAPLLYRYRAAFPGFATRLTTGEAAALARSPEVRAITPDTISHPLADGGSGGHGNADRPRAASDGGGGLLGRDGAAFLGLPDGLWRRLGGPDQAGAGVIVGVLDTGINPEHPSFADRPKGPEGPRYRGPDYSPPKVWKGTCQTTSDFPATSCNKKLIGARYFVDGFGTQNLAPGEFVSPRDANGHGSHTAATAAGNYGVQPKIGGHDLGIPMVSGIAPRAYVASYKVCWTGKEGVESPEGSCTSSDAVAAIDAAVSDGVDVINYSIGSDTSTLIGPVERAFLGAVNAGVFVANAAGNAGPNAGTVGSPAAVPWVMAVAASTLARTFETTFTVAPASGSGSSPVKGKGASLTGALAKTRLVDAASIPAAGVAADQAELCLPGSLNAAAVAGMAVLCKRGNNARVEKGKVVLDAGGKGMVLYNPEANQDLVADLHWLPAVHVSLEQGQAVKALLAGGAVPTLSLGGSRPADAAGDVMAAFSSRGPETAVPEIGKPDVTAPGVNILAAATPAPATGDRKGETFQIISGTSMASPHVAGAGALLTQLAPGWSPAAMKSALMTTAATQVVKQDGKTPADAFDDGAGRIDPNRAADPGLVLDASLSDYARYLEGQDPTIVDGDIPPLDAADLNLPAVSFSQLTGSDSTVRTFTSVDAEAGTWLASIEALPGIQGAVTPATFDIGAGQSQALTLSFTLAGAPFDSYSFGAVVLTNSRDRRTVRLPVSVRPVKIAAPTSFQVVTPEPADHAPVTVRAGYSGDLSALAWGLAPPQVAAGETVATAAGAASHEPSAGVKVYDVSVPAGTQVLAADVVNADGGAGDPDLDLDLFLFRDEKGDGFGEDDLVASSADADADESVALPRPPPGNYRFSVVGFKTRDPVSTYDFITWLGTDPSPDDPSTPSTAPALVITGDPKGVSPGDAVTLDLGWSGIPADATYFGLITFHDQAAPDPRQPVATSLVRLVKGPPGTVPRVGPGRDGKNAGLLRPPPVPDR